MYFYFALRHFYTSVLPPGPYLVTYEGRLWDFSPELKDRGISLSLPLSTAKHHAPEASVLAIDLADFTTAQERWLQWCLQWCDEVQPHYPHAWYARTHSPLLSPDSFGDPLQDLATDFQQQLFETGLQGTWGGGWSCCTAQLAARWNGTASQSLIITPNETADFLAPIPVRWAFPQWAEELTRLGLHQMGQVAKTPLPQLYQQFGANADILHKKSRGLDIEPFQPQQLLQLQWNFHFLAHPDFGSPPSSEQLHIVLRKGCDHLIAAVQQRQLAVKELKILWQLDGKEDVQQTLPFHKGTQDPQQLWRRLQPPIPSSPVQSAVVRISDWEKHQPQQLDLFSAPPPQKQAVETLVAQLQDRYGKDTITTLAIPRREKQLAFWEKATVSGL